MDKNKPLDKIILDLKERAKELNCLYEVQEILRQSDKELDEICGGIIKAIPPGWQYPDVCQASIILKNNEYQSVGFKETQWVQSANIILRDEVFGIINVYYTEERPVADEGPFLKEERKLINSIAEQFGMYLLHKHLKAIFEEKKQLDKEQRSEWWVIIDLLRRTDPKLLIRISRRMVNYLFWNGVKEAERLMEYISPAYKRGSDPLDEINKPYKKQVGSDILVISNDIYKVAEKHIGRQEILDC